MNAAPPIEVLLVEDNPGDAALVRHALRETNDPFRLEVAPTLHEGLERLDGVGVDIVLLDLNLPDSEGLDTFLRMRTRAPWIPVVVLSGVEDDEVALLAVRHGAQDYLNKGAMIRSEMIVRSIRYALERSRIETEIIQRDVRLEQAQDVAGLGWWEWDFATAHVACSEGLSRILGLGDQERRMPAGTFVGFFDASDQGRLTAALRDVAEARQPLSASFRIRRTDETLRHVELRCASAAGDPRRARRLVGTLQDVTERLEFEQKLRDRELFERIFETGVVACAITRSRDGHLIESNQGLSELTGYPRDEIRGSTLDALGLSIDAAERGRFFEELQRRGSVRNLEARIRNHHGEMRSVELSAHVVGYAGEPHVVYFLRDTTEQHRLQAQLLQAQKLEAVGRLGAGVAHDFNNLLTVIVTAVYFGRRDLPVDHPAQQSLAAIEQATASAGNLTRQLLAFGHQQIVTPKRLDPNERVRDLGKLLARVLGEDIEVHVGTAEPVGLVLIDPGQFEQVLMNLAVNARDAMPDRGRFSIDVASEWVSHEDAFRKGLATFGPYVRIDVRDTGVGMSDEVRAHAFEPFFTTKETGKGTGLGLATCHGIVTQAGGQITIDSAPGCGTTVSLYLPRHEGDAEPARAVSPREEDLPRGTETILVVEDEEAVRATVSRTLRELGYAVLEARDGVEANRIVTRAPDSPRVDLLLTDVILPLVGGVETADHLQSLIPELKVLYVSGYADHPAWRDRIKAGAAFLQKPFSPAALAFKVREVLAG